MATDECFIISVLCLLFVDSLVCSELISHLMAHKWLTYLALSQISIDLSFLPGIYYLEWWEYLLLNNSILPWMGCQNVEQVHGCPLKNKFDHKGIPDSLFANLKKELIKVHASFLKTNLSLSIKIYIMPSLLLLRYLKILKN